MIYPADDTLYNIEQRVRRGETDDDTEFLLNELKETQETNFAIIYALLAWFDSYFDTAESLIPDVAVKANKWLNETGYVGFDWNDEMRNG